MMPKWSLQNVAGRWVLQVCVCQCVPHSGQDSLDLSGMPHCVHGNHHGLTVTGGLHVGLTALRTEVFAVLVEPAGLHCVGLNLLQQQLLLVCQMVVVLHHEVKLLLVVESGLGFLHQHLPLHLSLPGGKLLLLHCLLLNDGQFSGLLPHLSHPKCLLALPLVVGLLSSLPDEVLSLLCLLLLPAGLCLCLLRLKRHSHLLQDLLALHLGSLSPGVSLLADLLVGLLLLRLVDCA
mmetsp:Transcript_39522/g.112073  ORF Transcript_39522/g.112073 Transcript_39522/m.112073 type:complete len:234 (+) Transcript_39522:250-951(+)